MAIKQCTSFSLAFVATITLLLAGNASANVAELCASSDYPALCKSMVKKKDDAKTATESTINALVLKTAQAKTSAGKLNDLRRGNLKMCREIYEDAISNLMTSINNLKSGDKASLNINLSAAMTDYETCHDSFLETPGEKDPLDKTYVLLHQMASNALALASEMH